MYLKTAFRNPLGRYQFSILSFGRTDAPATLQAVMSSIFRKHIGKFVLVYLDEILMFSKNPEEHPQHHTDILQQQHKLKAKSPKCVRSTSLSCSSLATL